MATTQKGRKTWVVTAVGIVVVLMSGCVFLLFSALLLGHHLKPQEELLAAYEAALSDPILPSGVSGLAARNTAKYMESLSIRMVLYSIVAIIAGIGIILRRHWGRWLFLLLVGVEFLSNITGIFIVPIIKYRASLSDVLSGLTDGLLIPIAVIAFPLIAYGFFMSPNVKAQFR